MSADETRQEAKSSIAITQNAKRDAQVTVKIYDGATLEEIDRIRQLAVATYLQTVTEVT